MMVEKTDLTKGSVLKNLIVFAAPTFFLTVVQALMNLTDMLIASNFGGVDVAAAVGMGGQISYLIITAIIGFSTGAAIYFGKKLGQKERKSFADALNNYLTLSIVAAIIIAAVFIPLSKPLLMVMATPEAAVQGADEYFVIQMSTMLIVLLFQAVNAVFRGKGESLPPLIFITVGGILNVGLDFLFLLIFHWGAAGISVATVISQGAALLLALIYIQVKKVFPLRRLHLKLQKQHVKELLKLGIPLGIENIAASVSFLIMIVIVNKIGGADAVYALTASAICMRFNAFFMLPARAMGMAISGMVAPNAGAGERKRVKQTVMFGLFISFLVGIMLTLAGFFGARGMINMFGGGEKVLGFGEPYLKAFSFDYFILPISVSLFGWFDGLGKTGISMTVNIITSFFIRIPLSLLLSAVCGLGITGVGISIPAASLVAAIIMILIGLIHSCRKVRRHG